MRVQGLIWGLGGCISLYVFFELGARIFVFVDFTRGCASYESLVPV